MEPLHDEPSRAPERSRRQRRAATRRAEILEAAAELFSRKGYERATTREIADAADVSEGTLYNYYGSKGELLNAVAKSFADDITAEIAALEAHNLRDMMAQLLSDRFRSGRERRLYMLFLYESRLNPDVHREVQGALQRIIGETEQRFRDLVASGVMRPVDPALAARAISATIMGFAAMYEMGQTGRSKNGVSAEQWGLALTDLFLNGLQKTDCEAEGETVE